MTSLFNTIQPGTTILTPNRRLSAALITQFNQLQIQQKKSCWETPDILPLQSWLQRTYQEYAAGFLLSPHQEKIIWEEILKKSPESSHLLQLSATADLAKSAWALLKQWQVDFSDAALTHTEDGQAFQQWASKFADLCKKHNWLDSSSVPDILQKNIATLIHPKKIILAGFTEITPQHQALFSAYEKNGTEIHYYESDRLVRSIQKISLSDEETEIRTMAQWAKNIYEKNTSESIYFVGCVVPRLEKIRDKVLRIFSETFSEKNTFTLDQTIMPFNISAGKSLANYPVIHAALILLGLNKTSLSIETVGHLLHSPFLGQAEQERFKRAYLDSHLRHANITTVSLKKLIDLSASCSGLTKRLSDYMTHFSHLEKSQSISAWTNDFIKLLTLLGWPGERSLNSQEYQVTQRWLELLTEYRTFDTILPAQTFSGALNYLTQLTVKTIFQIQTPDAPIQILGALEAAELPFEHLWIMGLDDTQWPPSPKPNPLIPQKLQKNLHMPHATAERELTYCQKLTQQLQKSADNIIFSHALKNEDVELRESSLLKNITPAAENILIQDKLTISHRSTTEIIEDNIAPAITEGETIHGGISIFKLQAACPFKAFAEIRLHAKKLESPTTGLRSLDRGNIAHKTLELIWLDLKDSFTLKNLSDTELQNLIHHHAEHAIQQIATEQISNKRYLALELIRLKKLISQWLQLEKNRPDFKVVACEYEKSAIVGPVSFNLRVDRIDELEEGDRIIIDYKTGKYNDIKNWFGDRPDEPQLPLYCITENEKMAGIAFAQLSPGELELKGVSARDLGIKSIKTISTLSYEKETTTWQQQLHNWQTVLTQLGSDFYQGIAHVSPKKTEETCRQCNLQSLCRISEKMQ